MTRASTFQLEFKDGSVINSQIPEKYPTEDGDYPSVILYKGKALIYRGPTSRGTVLRYYESPETITIL